MKTTVKSVINSIKKSAADLQNLSFSEFRTELPLYLNKGLGYQYLDYLFIAETGITIKTYFNRIKALKARELFDHYHLSPLEVAFQLGYETPSAMMKSTRSKAESESNGFRKINFQPRLMPYYV